jgi:PAS domain-containing protein
MPALTQGGTMLAITGDRKGLEMLHDLVSEFDHLEEYRADAEKHLAAIDLFDAIRRAVAEKPGILQNKMKSEVGAEDGRLVSNLVSWLEKAGEISRAKNGKTYALYLEGVEMSAKDALAVYTEPPRPGSHQAKIKPGKPIELDLDKLTLVPLPPSPEAWASQVALPATSETFEDAEGAWRELTVEAIAPADRPDPAFRKHFTTRGGVLSFDDLAKSEASLGAPGAVMFISEQGGNPMIEQLERPVYALDVHPEGQGFATRSKMNILTVYGADLKVDFETDLSATPEVAAGRLRLDLDEDGGIFWGEPHLAINCIALSPRRDRYLYTHVDEAWCIDRHGKRLWGVRMPERPVETYHHTFEVGGMGGHTGTAKEIEEALEELELALPVTPDEIRQKYRGLVRQLHPDLNPGNEARMKAVNAAYEALTGASHDDLQGKKSAEDLLRFSATVSFMTGGGPDRLQSAAFSGSGDTVLLGTSQGV